MYIVNSYSDKTFFCLFLNQLNFCDFELTLLLEMNIRNGSNEFMQLLFSRLTHSLTSSLTVYNCC